MTHRETHHVTTEAARPAGKPNECFYCHRVVGQDHAADCVLRKRTVILRTTFEYMVEVPEDWDVKLIEFHRNEGSWCADNILDDLAEFSKRVGCLCPFSKTQFVREATEDDEKAVTNSGMRVAVVDPKKENHNE